MIDVLLVSTEQKQRNRTRVACRVDYSYLSKAQEEQLLVAVVDEARQNLLIRAACDQPLVRSVRFPDAAVVGDVFTLGVDAVHLRNQRAERLSTRAGHLGTLFRRHRATRERVERTCAPILTVKLSPSSGK